MEHRLATLRERIAAACARAGRSADEVVLVAVSKTQPAEAVRAAFAGGVRDFGENYVQELVGKARELPELRWHFIGHLQSNKVRALLECPGLALVHTVDRPKLFADLERRAESMNRALDVLVQVNVSGEESKSGCAPSELASMLAAGAACTRVRVRGLMTMPPIVEDSEMVRPHFRRLCELRDAHGGVERLPELSMGMTQDFEVAIEEGATLVRIGTALFGARA